MLRRYNELREEPMPVKPALLLSIGRGTIEPAGRALDVEVLDDMIERLRGDEFYVPTDRLRPNAAGGTLSLVVGDALTTGRFRRPGDTAKVHAKAVYTYLQKTQNSTDARRFIPAVCVDGRTPVKDGLENPAVVGGHDDEHGPEGCGAQKRLGDILTYLSQHGDEVRGLMAAIGVDIDDTTHEATTARSASLLDEGYVSPGSELRQALVDVAGKQSVATLAGEHNEVVLVINTQDGTTLDRAKLREVFGDEYEAFNVDVAALKKSAEAMSLTPEEAQQKFVAMLYYNVATAAVLAGPSLRIVVR